MKRSAAAIGLDIRQTVLIGKRLLCENDRGDLYQWSRVDQRWIRLELTTILYDARAPRHYAGHPMMAPRVGA